MRETRDQHMPASSLAPEVQGPFRPCTSLVLASASPRRQALLTQLGLHFQVHPSPLPEPPPEPCEAAAGYVQRMAEHKARNVGAKKLPGIILAADTVVVADSDILGKPDSYDQALEMLSRLNGRTHSVHTGCVIMDQSDPDNSRAFTVSTQVAFAAHSEAVLAAYARTGEPMGKAGGYAIQGSGGFLIAEIQGSWSNVVGLPLSETAAALLGMQAIRI